MELFLPSLVENRVEKYLSGQLEEKENLQIEVISFPALKILFSRADRIYLEADVLNLEGLVLKDVSLHYSDVVLNDGFTGVNDRVNIMLTEEAVNNYVSKNYNQPKNLSIKFNPGQMFVEGDFDVFGYVINFKTEGNLILEKEANRVVFVPGELQVKDYRFSEDIIRSILSGLNLSLDLNELGLPLKFDQILIRDEEVLLLGGMEGDG